jgi:hypothetical protein
MLPCDIYQPGPAHKKSAGNSWLPAWKIVTELGCLLALTPLAAAQGA